MTRVTLDRFENVRNAVRENNEQQRLATNTEQTIRPERVTHHQNDHDVYPYSRSTVSQIVRRNFASTSTNGVPPLQAAAAAENLIVVDELMLPWYQVQPRWVSSCIRPESQYYLANNSID